MRKFAEELWSSTDRRVLGSLRSLMFRMPDPSLRVRFYSAFHGVAKILDDGYSPTRQEVSQILAAVVEIIVGSEDIDHATLYMDGMLREIKAYKHRAQDDA